MCRHGPHRTHMSLFRAKRHDSANPKVLPQAQACAPAGRRPGCRWSPRTLTIGTPLIRAQKEFGSGPRNSLHWVPACAGTNEDDRFRHAQSFGRLATDLVWRERQPSSRLAIFVSDSASTAAARSAALVAPALPIARVPTGTPPGICMIDNSESLPFRVRVFIGTPNTGSGVIEIGRGHV